MDAPRGFGVPAALNQLEIEENRGLGDQGRIGRGTKIGILKSRLKGGRPPLLGGFTRAIEESRKPPRGTPAGLSRVQTRSVPEPIKNFLRTVGAQATRLKRGEKAESNGIQLYFLLLSKRKRNETNERVE